MSAGKKDESQEVLSAAFPKDLSRGGKWKETLKYC